MADLRLFIDNGTATLIIDGINTDLTIEEISVLIEGLTEVRNEIAHMEIEARKALDESYREVPEIRTFEERLVDEIHDSWAQVIHVDPERWGRG